MGKWLFISIILGFASTALALDCSSSKLPKNQCSSKLTTLQNIWSDFYRDGNVRRSNGCSKGLNRGEKDKFCNEDKCEAIRFIEACGVEVYATKLLPVMAQGGQDDIIQLSLEKYPKVLEKIDHKDPFWDEYYSDKKVFYTDTPHLKIKISLYEKGFVPENPLWMGTLYKNIQRRIAAKAFNEGLQEQYESSSFLKDFTQSKADLETYKSLKEGSSLAPVDASSFSRISTSYLGSASSKRDLLAKKLELTSVALKLGQTPDCFTPIDFDQILDGKKNSPEIDRFISHQIDCRPVKEKEEIIKLIQILQANKMLSKEIFEKLVSRLSKSEDLSDQDILAISGAMSLFDKERALKLSLLEFNSIHNYALNLDSKDCPEDSAAHKLMSEFQLRIIHEQTADFFKNLASSSMSLSDIKKSLSEKEIDLTTILQDGTSFYSILAEKPKDAFSEGEWKELIDLVLVKSYDSALKQVGGLNERDDKSAFGSSIRNQNVALFKLFVDIKKKRPNFHYGDEKKTALAINRQAGGNSEIKDILKDDSYFDK